MRFSSLLTAVAVPLFLVVISASAQSSRSTISDTKQAAVAAFEEGQNAQQHGDLSSAVRFYTNAISLDSSLYQAYYQRATALAGLGREREAEADLRKVNEIEPNFARAHRALGQILLDRGNTAEANRELSRAIELDPKLTGVRVYYGSGLLKANQPDRSIEQFKVAIEQKEELPLAYSLLGVAEERVGKVTEAFSDYSKAIELDPANAIAHEGRGRIYDARNETARAIEDYTIAFRSQPSRDLAVRLGALHTRAGQGQAAIQIYRRLLLEKPEDFEVRAEMACVMAENDQADEAEKEIARVLLARPKDAKLLCRFGDVYYKTNPALAVDYYRRAAEADPNDLRARSQLGASLVRSMQIEAAIPILNEVIQTDPKNYPAHASLATALFKQKQYVEAAREFLWIIRAKPEIPASYYFLAISLDHLGDCEQALKCYQEFLRKADAASNKNEIDEANTRAARLQRLIKDGKCRSAGKGKHK